MNVRTRMILPALAVLLVSCSTSEPPPQAENPHEVPVTAAELLGSDAAWGNTEGPAVDSSGALYFTSRGAYKGVIKWTEAEGAQQYAAVATMAGPGGLWIDEADNIYLTATDEREVQRLSPSGELTTIAKGFEADPATAKGPNDITVSRAGRVYFTDPNGYYGESAPGTVYVIDADGSVRVFDDTVVGPNGIVLSADDRTLYVANNVGQTQSTLVSWPLAPDGGAAGPKKIVAEFEPCVADGMAVDADGHVWVACYSFGTAHLFDPATGDVVQRVTTEQKALTNLAFGRNNDRRTLYLSSSDMDRETGYVYRATVNTPGVH